MVSTSLPLMWVIKSPAFSPQSLPGQQAPRAVSTGEHPLTRELYMKAIGSFQPSKKDEIIRSLDAWDADVQKKMAG